MTNSLKNTWAVVTGAGSGIGKAVALELALRGYNVVVVGRRKDALSEVCQLIEQVHKVKTRAVPLDLTATDAIGQLEQATLDIEVQILVSNAGADAMGALLSIEIDALRSALHLNTRTHLEIAHSFGRRFLSQGKGNILLISSIAGLQGTPYLGNYAGSKGYIFQLGMAMNYELRATNVGVTVLLPGPTRTPGVLNRTDVLLAEIPGPLMDPNKVARIGLNALEQGRPYVIPGFTNKLLAAISQFIGPTFSRNLWGKLTSKVTPEKLSITAQSRF